MHDENVTPALYGKLTALPNEMASPDDRNRTAAKADDASVPE